MATKQQNHHLCKVCAKDYLTVRGALRNPVTQEYSDCVKADVNQSEPDGYTALMLAAMNGHHICVNLLLNLGADVNESGKDDCTALMKAAINGHYKCVKLLVESGADVNKKDVYGFSAFEMLSMHLLARGQ